VVVLARIRNAETEMHHVQERNLRQLYALLFIPIGNVKHCLVKRALQD
jgi:hypothetical protein